MNKLNSKGFETTEQLQISILTFLIIITNSLFIFTEKVLNISLLQRLCKLYRLM